MIAIAIVPDVVDGLGAATIAATVPLAQAVQRLAAGEADVLAVIGGEGTVVGLVDAGRVVAAIAAAGADALALPVADWARPAPDWLEADDSALDALELMRLHDGDHLPVGDAAGRLIGIVGRRRLADLLHQAYERAADERHRAVFGLAPDGA